MSGADLTAEQMSKADLRADLFRNAPALGTHNDSDDKNDDFGYHDDHYHFKNDGVKRING